MVANFTDILNVPNLTLIEEKTLEELKSLSITKIHWNKTATLGFTLSNGETYRAGTRFSFSSSHNLDPTKKITKIDVIIWKSEDFICRINFYSGD